MITNLPNPPDVNEALNIPPDRRTSIQKAIINIQARRNKKHREQQITLIKETEAKAREAKLLREAKAREAKMKQRIDEKLFKCWLYFIQRPDTGAIKIGYTTRKLIMRFDELCREYGQELRFLGAVPIENKKREKIHHKQFIKYHIAGEWFQPVRSILDYIDLVCPKKDL